MLSFYILFLIPLFLIHPHKLFSMQLGPSTTSLACARLIVLFAPFSTFLLIENTSSFCSCTFYSTATHTTPFLPSFLPFGHSFHWYPSSLHLKQCIAFLSSFLSFSCLLISTPHLITLLDNASNLF